MGRMPRMHIVFGYLAICLLGLRQAAADAGTSQSTLPTLQQQAPQQAPQRHQQQPIPSNPITETLTATAWSSGVHSEQQQLRHRKLAQDAPSGWKPSSDEKERSKHAGHFSAGHAVVVFLLCLIAMAVLGYSGYKAMQWYERTKRPGYVELQSLDTAFHRPFAF